MKMFTCMFCQRVFKLGWFHAALSVEVDDNFKATGKPKKRLRWQCNDCRARARLLARDFLAFKENEGR